MSTRRGSGRRSRPSASLASIHRDPGDLRLPTIEDERTRKDAGPKATCLQIRLVGDVLSDGGASQAVEIRALKSERQGTCVLPRWDTHSFVDWVRPAVVFNGTSSALFQLSVESGCPFGHGAVDVQRAFLV
jgi:hypothetical protein